VAQIDKDQVVHGFVEKKAGIRVENKHVLDHPYPYIEDKNAVLKVHVLIHTSTIGIFGENHEAFGTSLSLDDRGICYTIDMKQADIQAAETAKNRRRHQSGGTRPMLSRIYFIDRKIASGDYPSTRQLAEEYEVGTATISRDIEFLRDRIGAPIEYDSHRRGYYYVDKNYRLPAAFSRPEDLLALGMVKNLITLYRDTPLYSASNELLNSLYAPVAVNGGPGKPWYEDRVVVPPVAAAPVSTVVWDTITAGLRENRIVTFEYLGLNDEDYTSRRVRPYQLLFDNGLWFLYGYAEERRAVRVFSLPRIKNPVLTENFFKLPADFDYRKNNGDSRFGIFAGRKKQQYRIALYEEAVSWAADRQWAADQRIETKAGRCTLSFSSVQFNKVLEWVLSQGCAAKPLEPKELVDAWKDTVRTMGEMADSV
jgi:predicted DNA-binding transcriptional regulator YafY